MACGCGPSNDSGGYYYDHYTEHYTNYTISFNANGGAKAYLIIFYIVQSSTFKTEMRENSRTLCVNYHIRQMIKFLLHLLSLHKA